jgi:hypothetical protein
MTKVQTVLILGSSFIACVILFFSILFWRYNKIEGNKKIDVTRIVDFVLWFIKEMINTISSKPSHFSSKRIERLLLFVSGVSIMDLYAYTHRLTMTAEMMLMIVGAQMVWAGFNTTQLTTDKKVHAKIEKEAEAKPASTEEN